MLLRRILWNPPAHGQEEQLGGDIAHFLRWSETERYRKRLMPLLV